MASRSSMLNRPAPSEIIEIPTGLQKVAVETDLKVPNCIYMVLEREDHTIGNLMRTQLLRDSNVNFAAYRNPHPLEPNIQLRVQTIATTNPYAATHNALSALMGETNNLLAQFRSRMRSATTPY